MSQKSQARREKLRIALVDAAEQQIRKGGIRSIKARDLAKQVGCAVGAIYNVFADMGALVMAVNGRTFLALGKAVAASKEAAGDVPPREALIIMSHAYLDFAAEHTLLWRALFDLELTADEVPEWYLSELNSLFSHISSVLTALWPDRDAEDISLMTRALFSSVHGIVLLGLQERISGVPKPLIAKMITKTLSELT